jgi:hypothetical protein
MVVYEICVEREGVVFFSLRDDLPSDVAFCLNPRLDGSHNQRLKTVRLSVNDGCPYIMVKRELQSASRKILEDEFFILPNLHGVAVAENAGSSSSDLSLRYGVVGVRRR